MQLLFYIYKKEKNALVYSCTKKTHSQTYYGSFYEGEKSRATKCDTKLEKQDYKYEVLFYIISLRRTIHI